MKNLNLYKKETDIRKWRDTIAHGYQHECCENDNSAKIYLQIQCTPNQNPHPFFTETEKEQYSTLRIEPQKNHIQPKNSEQKEQCWA